MAETRIATLNDIPAVLDLIITSVSNERLWTSFVPSKKDHAADYRQEAQALLEEHISSSNDDWVVEVVDIGTADSPEIVSAAIWDLSATKGHGGQSKRQPKTPIENSNLEKSYRLIQNGFDTFVKRWPKFMYLQILVTHPQHRGQGYAKDLLHAAIAREARHGGIISALGGPAGYVFFSGLKFRDLGAVEIPNGVGDDSHAIKAMSLVVEKKDESWSVMGAVWNYLSN